MSWMRTTHTKRHDAIMLKEVRTPRVCPCVTGTAMLRKANFRRRLAVLLFHVSSLDALPRLAHAPALRFGAHSILSCFLTFRYQSPV